MNEDDLMQFADTLKRQSEHLDELPDTLRKDCRDIHIMKTSLNV